VTPTFLSKNASMTVLLAEDDLDDQELLEEAFNEVRPGILLLSFSSGKKFIQTLESLGYLPDMIIVDYNIPEMNGAEILQHLKLRSEYDQMAKIVWSTSNSPFYKNTCMDLGATAYFVKPSTLAGLTELARTILTFVKK
jgi:CheY-like chemotaxis protein